MHCRAINDGRFNTQDRHSDFAFLVALPLPHVENINPHTFPADIQLVLYFPFHTLSASYKDYLMSAISRRANTQAAKEEYKDEEGNLDDK